MKPWGKNSNKKREMIFVIAEILEIAKKEAAKTHIMYNANLTFRQINEYLKFMLEINLLEASVENDRKVYKVTEKGIDFLRRSYELTEFLKTEDDNKNGIKTPPMQLLGIKC